MSFSFNCTKLKYEHIYNKNQSKLNNKQNVLSRLSSEGGHKDNVGCILGEIFRFNETGSQLIKDIVNLTLSGVVEEKSSLMVGGNLEDEESHSGTKTLKTIYLILT